MTILADYAPLHQSSFDRDACGIGLIADIPGRRSHEIIPLAVEALAGMEHRGAGTCWAPRATTSAWA